NIDEVVPSCSIPVAEVAELADAHGSGPCTRKGVGVRVPSSAPMKQLSITCFLMLTLMVACSAQSPRSTTSYQYFRTGAAQDAATHPRFGIAMMGGGSDLDPAFVWLCDHADH